MAEISPEYLRELAAKIIEDPSAIDDLNENEVTELRKHINPIGGIVDSGKSFANISIINWRERWLRKLHITALVGYLYRAAFEYTPEIELDKEQRRYEAELRDINSFNNLHVKSDDNYPVFGNTANEAKVDSNVNTARLADAERNHTERVKLIKSTCKGIIGQFLDRNFEFNPDLHVRGTHTSNPNDSDRKDKAEAIKTAVLAPDVDVKLRAQPDKFYQYSRSNALSVYNAATVCRNETESLLKVIMNPHADLADSQSIIYKKHKQLGELCADMKKICDPMIKRETLSAWTVDPPADTMFHFDRYLTNHYEELREITTSLFDEKSDLEFGVIYYKTHKTAEDAENYRTTHSAEFKCDVMGVQSAHINLLGPFKENRDRVSFYNKNTTILEKMMDQLEVDQKLGRDLMEKKVKTKKKKNIETEGPDHPGLKAYSKLMNQAAELGAKKVLTREEQDAMNEAKIQADKIKEDYEVPDEAIRMDVFVPVERDGETVLEKRHFFTQEEKAVHLEDPDQADKYQPNRHGAPLADGYTTKTIVSKTGEKRKITVPIDIAKDGGKDSKDSKDSVTKK